MISRKRKVSDVKALILDMLANGQWVSSLNLLKATNQKYFDRRIRELRDESGYDIVTGVVEGKPHYRLRSKRRLPTKFRTYLGSAQKSELLKDLPPQCAICGNAFNKNKKSVFDHRVPLLRSGEGTKTNFQLVCQDCNNQKRTQCKGCALECKTCYFAFPEKYPKPLMIKINAEELMKITNFSEKLGVTVEECCKIILMDRIGKKET